MKSFCNRQIEREKTTKHLHTSFLFRTFVGKKRRSSGYTINPIINPEKHTRIMNKTVKTILQVISYIIAAILGAAGEATLM